MYIYILAVYFISTTNRLYSLHNLHNLTIFRLYNMEENCLMLHLYDR